LPPVPAVPDHRPRGGLGADVDGHDDAAAGRGVPALQADLLRAGRRLVAGRRQPGAELRGLARQPLPALPAGPPKSLTSKPMADSPHICLGPRAAACRLARSAFPETTTCD